MQIETILSLLPTALVASLNSSIFSFVNFDLLSLRYDFIFIAELVWLFDHLGSLTREAKWLVEGTLLTDSSYRLSLVLVNGHDTFGFTLANIWSAILLSPVCWQLPHPPLPSTWSQWWSEACSCPQIILCYEFLYNIVLSVINVL